jgi:protein-S-isoprenylcysteine O-methyltransferase Ste14
MEMSSRFQVTQLTVINLAKTLTLIIILILAIIYGIHDARQVIYLCLHGGYCSWWLLEQYLFPCRKDSIFTEKVGISTFVSMLLFVGVFYSLPAVFAFTNTAPLGYITMAISLLLYTFGSLINTAADVQKMTAKNMGEKLIKTEIWRSIRNVNYLGDLMRYTSFAIVSGSLWSAIIPLTLFALYIQRILDKEKSMSDKYSDFSLYKQQSSRLIPWVW